jgi:hypothetical protein
MCFYSDNYYWIVIGNQLLKTLNIQKWSKNKRGTRIDKCFTAAITKIQRTNLNAKQNEAQLLFNIIDFSNNLLTYSIEFAILVFAVWSH